MSTFYLILINFVSRRFDLSFFLASGGGAEIEGDEREEKPNGRPQRSLKRAASNSFFHWRPQ